MTRTPVALLLGLGLACDSDPDPESRVETAAEPSEAGPIARLPRLGHRYERRVEPPVADWVPWPAPPLSCVARIEFDEPVALVPPVTEPGVDFDYYFYKERPHHEDWQRALVPDRELTHAAVVLPFSRCIPSWFDDAESPAQTPSTALEIRAAADRLVDGTGVTADVVVDCDVRAFTETVERVRAFYMGEGLSLRLDARNGPMAREAVERRLRELGFAPDPVMTGIFVFTDEGSGLTEPLLSATVRGGEQIEQFRLSVDLGIQSADPEAVVRLLVEGAKRLSDALDTTITANRTERTEPDEILSDALETVRFLRDAGRLWPYDRHPRWD